MARPFVRFLTACATLSVLSVGATADATNPPPPVQDPGDVYVESLVYNGSGCPTGTAAISLAADRSAFTLLFDRFIAQGAPGFTFNDARKNCAMSVKLHIPGGFSVAIKTVDYRGFAELDPTVTGIMKTSAWFQGEQDTTSAQANLAGPFADNYLQSQDIPIQNTVFSPCGQDQILNINGEVRVDNHLDRTKSGLMTADTVDGKIRQVFHLEFQKCQ